MFQEEEGGEEEEEEDALRNQELRCSLTTFLAYLCRRAEMASPRQNISRREGGIQFFQLSSSSSNPPLSPLVGVRRNRRDSRPVVLSRARDVCQHTWADRVIKNLYFTTQHVARDFNLYSTSDLCVSRLERLPSVGRVQRFYLDEFSSASGIRQAGGFRVSLER